MKKQNRESKAKLAKAIRKGGRDWNEGGKVQWSGKVQTLASLLNKKQS